MRLATKTMKRFSSTAFLAGTLVLCAFPLAKVLAATGVSGYGGQAAQPSAGAPATDPGAAVYASKCAMCHGKERQGNAPIFPSLIGVKSRLSDDQIKNIIHNGRGKMPPVGELPAADLTALLHFLGSTTETAPGGGMAETPNASAPEASAKLNTAPLPVHSEQAEKGKGIFEQNCAFCHGRDAMGGESGPDLTRSKLVISDSGGDKISNVVLNGRIEKKMPAFSFSRDEMQAVVAFLHAQVASAAGMKGGRRGVDVEDLQTGNVAAGKQYFEGAGGCVKCHSATGDLAGVASKYEGLQLEERMLYPKDVKSKVTVTPPGGQAMSGELAYLDEFTVGLRDNDGVYHSWKISGVKYSVDAPVEAHVALFPKYTDDDIHNLMAYIQTLR